MVFICLFELGDTIGHLEHYRERCACELVHEFPVSPSKAIGNLDSSDDELGRYSVDV